MRHLGELQLLIPKPPSLAWEPCHRPLSSGIVPGGGRRRAQARDRPGDGEPPTGGLTHSQAHPPGATACNHPQGHQIGRPPGAAAELGLQQRLTTPVAGNHAVTATQLVPDQIPGPPPDLPDHATLRRSPARVTDSARKAGISNAVRSPDAHGAASVCGPSTLGGPAQEATRSSGSHGDCCSAGCSSGARAGSAQRVMSVRHRCAGRPSAASARCRSSDHACSRRRPAGPRR